MGDGDGDDDLMMAAVPEGLIARASQALSAARQGKKLKHEQKQEQKQELKEKLAAAPVKRPRSDPEDEDIFAGVGR